MANAKCTTETFVHELPLQADPRQEKIILVRLECGRQLYNACLGEGLKRLRLMRESRAWKKAGSLPKGSKERAEAFRELDTRFKFRDYDLQEFAIRTKNACHLKNHLDAHVCQKIGTRAFLALREHAFGKRGMPRFKRKGQFGSLEGKSNASGIRWRDDKILWSGLELRPLFDKKDKSGIQANALASRVKYVRIVRRELRGENRFYAQLILEGAPKARHPVAKGVVGLDLGPSSIAAVSVDSDAAFLKPFCPDVEDWQDEIRQLQQKMNRSLRAMNPKAFNKKGKVKRGVKLRKSKRFLSDKRKLRELRRRQKAARKTSHGELANSVLSMGSSVHAENISYKGWQSGLFGKSVGRRAPGMFVAMLRRKAASAGGGVNEFPLRNKLSQTCHNCGAIVKKPLSERWHECGCGVFAQRDLYSAFLAMCVAGDDFDISKARESWPGAEPLLRRALSECQKTAIGESRLASFGLGLGHGRRRSSSPAEGESMPEDARDAVADLRERNGESPGNPGARLDVGVGAAAKRPSR